ncbi:hypothetical protein LTR56_007679 [Elasticomyces elasticus]|nr:hypothetical protein LTR56_007679 [Elasticomyces elasticus]KAK3661949.1 hypothetical protein LTR22_007323 [Elasticomyces elasticus]KAK4925538.1 hypothetical protein LTR49_007376 [Elasticomyces elasticus]KAK5759816.1 hypothetical protein LTS12_010003 [Elasticomyces elasticus]
MATDRLFQPLKLGNLDLGHRMVMAPLTRFRADNDYVPALPMSKTYYEERACVPGTLLITEATLISPRASGYENAPGIWNTTQIAAWKVIVNAVHAKGSFIFLQLWALGRVARKDVIENLGHRVVSSSARAVNGEDGDVPHALTESEIKGFVQDYADAAKNAVEAGFDGVEIHGANGYLIDQFWQDTVRVAYIYSYGGSIENRARFGLEVTRAVVDAVGDSRKVGMRLSPFSDFQGMGMIDPISPFSHIIRELKGLNLAYLHLIESRVEGTSAVDAVYASISHDLDPLVAIWGTESPIIVAGGFTPDKAKNALREVYTGANVAVAFGRSWISNPDLAFRIPQGIELTGWDRETFYERGSREGYLGYPFSKEWEAREKEKETSTERSRSQILV